MPEPDFIDQVRRLEEHLGFAEHTIDQLSQVLREAIDAQRLLETRIAALERRLSVVESPSFPCSDQPSSGQPASHEPPSDHQQ